MNIIYFYLLQADSAIAAAAPAGPNEEMTKSTMGSNWSFWILLAFFFILLMFFSMNRPQRKQQKELQKFRDGLKKGDKIVMKTIAKIFILITSIAFAIGGIMLYAKTRVDPPVSFQPINQFEEDLNNLYPEVTKISAEEEDMIYLKTINRISVFEKETRLTKAESDRQKEKLIDWYSPAFLKRCFAIFDNSVWENTDLDYMLVVSNRLRSVKYSDGSMVLNGDNLGGLNLVENIISNYHQAWTISQIAEYKGISSARNTINQAKRFASDPYLSKCADLRNLLNKVKTKIGQSHYAFVSDYVELLSEYKDYGSQYYENTLVPQVNAAITEYDNNANALYGFKNDVNVLRNKAKSYINAATRYYEYGGKYKDSASTSVSSQHSTASNSSYPSGASRTIYAKKATIKVGEKISAQLTEGRIDRWEINQGQSPYLRESGNGTITALKEGNIVVWGYINNSPKLFEFTIAR